MEISASALSSAMKVGLQIASSYRGPHLEIYYELINQFGPEQEYTMPALTKGGISHVSKTRSQDVYIQFQVINIGGQRAENIRLRRSGSFERGPNRDFGGLFECTIPQMAPGQVLQLFLLDTHELDIVGPDGRVASFKEDDLIIDAEYDSPAGVVNGLKTALARLRRRPHHSTQFRFSPKLVMGDFPPARYA